MRKMLFFLRDMKIMSLFIIIMSTMPFTFSLHVNIMVLYETIGEEANRTDIHKLAPVWESYINNKTQTDKTYPFSISVESFETASDCQR
jgi:hypothetical protein